MKPKLRNKNISQEHVNSVFSRFNITVLWGQQISDLTGVNIDVIKMRYSIIA